MNYFIANWKMNMDFESVNKWVDVWSKKDVQNDINIVIAPTSVHFSLLIKLQNVELSSQDVSEFEKGAHTGSIGAFQVKDFCKYSIVGHSERNETFEHVMKKAKKCIESQIIPIICFVDERSASTYYLDGSIIAWEDPENISKKGAYNAKSPDEIRESIINIKSEIPANARVLYGGSVNKQNISELKKIDILDGVLVGNASLDPDHFYEICTKI